MRTKMQRTVALPDLASMSGTISEANLQVADFVDSLVEYVDEIVDATNRSDWREVQKLAEYIAVSSFTFGMPNVSDAADYVVEAAMDLDNEYEIRSRVNAMVGEYRRSGRRTSEK